MKTPQPNTETGFTLLELVITLIVAGILGAMLFTFFGSAITKSGVPLERLEKAISLQTIIENITVDYREKYLYDLNELKAKITNGDYGTYTVVDNNFIKFEDGSEVTDDGGAETLLKVTLKNDLGEQVTTLFHESN